MLSNGGVVVSPEINRPDFIWEGLPDTHEIISGFEQYNGAWDETSLKRWWKESGFRSQFPFSKKKLNKMDGWANCVDRELVKGTDKILRSELEEKLERLDKPDKQWTLRCMGNYIKKGRVSTSDLPSVDEPKRVAFVCYESFEEDQKQKPVIYWRELRHKQSMIFT